MTGAALAMLAGGCTRLRTVSLSNCPNFGTLHEIPQPLVQLQSLTIKDTPLQDADVAIIAHGCPGLTYFCIQTEAITGAAITAISRSLRALSSLCLSGCSSIRDDVTDVQLMPQLQRLSIYDCDGMSAVSCLALVIASPCLWSSEAITIDRCAQIEDLRSAMPSILRAKLQTTSAPMGCESGGGGSETMEEDISADPSVGESPASTTAGVQVGNFDSEAVVMAVGELAVPPESVTSAAHLKLYAPLLLEAAKRVVY
eukprot:SAG31_NODE_4464_length_3212_cov_1.240283_2_plen_256_part_00